MNGEKSRLQGDLETMETSFRDLRVRYEELKKLNEQSKAVSRSKPETDNEDDFCLTKNGPLT
jgi:hypothetical protein